MTDMGNSSQAANQSNLTLTVPTFNQVSLIKTSVLSALFVVSLFGNTATLIQMYRMRRRRSTINTLILHLAVADLIVTFFCFVTDAVWASTVQWYAGNGLCKLIKFLQVFGLYLSSYVVVIISIDRCYAILDPMSKNSAPRRVRNLIIVAWVLSALFSSPQVNTDLPLKTKDHQFDNLVVTGGTVSCRNDNLRCHPSHDRVVKLTMFFFLSDSCLGSFC